MSPLKSLRLSFTGWFQVGGVGGVKLRHGTEVPVDGTFVDFPLDDTLSSTIASWHRDRGVASLDSSEAWQ